MAAVSAHATVSSPEVVKVMVFFGTVIVNAVL
jgi:hypothetical protein